MRQAKLTCGMALSSRPGETSASPLERSARALRPCCKALTSLKPMHLASTIELPPHKHLATAARFYAASNRGLSHAAQL